MRGVVAAGHPLTAEAGAQVLREGGTAGGAAVAAVLMSFVAESPLTGPGAGGFMLVHTAEGENQLLDFFVAAPGEGLSGVQPAALQPIDVHFSAEAIQVFNIGPSSCGVYGTLAGLDEAVRRFGTMPLSALVERPARAARDGVELTPMAASFLVILGPILTATPQGCAVYAPQGDLLERLGRSDVRTLVEVMDRTNRERTDEFVQGLNSEGYLERFLHKEALETAATELGTRLGSTTHIAALDADGACASVTCSNGSCSGVVVPGTGIHLNNMLGEEDLNPGGFHRHQPGRRIPSMMAPTVVLRDGQPEVALGSAGSNRIRSAILQTTLRVVDDGLPAEQAVAAPRVHYEGRMVEAEPGVDEEALAALQRSGWPIQRFRERSLYFGGVQAVARDPATGELSGGGDPRRGGAAVVVE